MFYTHFQKITTIFLTVAVLALMLSACNQASFVKNQSASTEGSDSPTSTSQLTKSVDALRSKEEPKVENAVSDQSNDSDAQKEPSIRSEIKFVRDDKGNMDYTLLGTDGAKTEMSFKVGEFLKSKIPDLDAVLIEGDTISGLFRTENPINYAKLQDLLNYNYNNSYLKTLSYDVFNSGSPVITTNGGGLFVVNDIMEAGPSLYNEVSIGEYSYSEQKVINSKGEDLFSHSESPGGIAYVSKNGEQLIHTYNQVDYKDDNNLHPCFKIIELQTTHVLYDTCFENKEMRIGNYYPDKNIKEYYVYSVRDNNSYTVFYYKDEQQRVFYKKFKSSEEFAEHNREGIDVKLLDYFQL